MGRKVAYAPRKSRARWFVLAGLALVGGLGYAAHQQATALAGRALNLAFANADTDVQGVFFDWNGDVVGRDVALYLDAPVATPAPTASTPAGAAPDAEAEADAGTLRFARMRVHVADGWMFYLRNVLDRRLEKADVDALKLTLEDFDSSAGVDPTLGALGPIGAISASPFESAGCLQHAFFLRSELEQMGLPVAGTTLSFDLREAASRITTRIVLDTPNVSRAQYEREETVAKETSLLRLREVATSTHAERWEVSDQGFVRARNAFCAKQDGVDAETFAARHVLTVQRLLQTRGLVPDAATAAAYAHFAANGGQFAFGGRYASPMHSSERAAAHRDGSAMLRLQAVAEHGSTHGPVQWRGTMPRALAAGPAFAAIVAENGGIAPVGEMPAVATAEAPQMIQASMTTEATRSPAPVAAPVQRPRYASSFAQPTATAPGGRLGWDDMPRYQGHLIQVFSMRAEPRTAVLLSANGRELHVRARMEGGHADYRISRDAFTHAMLIQ
jgi:hypothetical protein